MLDRETCHQARLSRDARFDGHFFTAVKSTGIYCRPVCPATPPQEHNVAYFTTAVEAAQAGYRPCLRCRPDSAPGSPAWKGVDTTLERALRLINEGALQEGTLAQLSDRLGISDRYLRRLFQKRFGVAPKTYALYQQSLFAKQLLHQTRLPITEVAYASGFRSIRRFNDCFRQQIGLNPSQLRRYASPDSSELILTLAYRPPFAWDRLHRFLARRLIHGQEWLGDDFYGRTFTWRKAKGHFTATHAPRHHCFRVALAIDDLSVLQGVVGNIRRLLDLDADTRAIERHLNTVAPGLPLVEGLRLPGMWDLFEAGVRAILGQQISELAARRLVQNLVDALGDPLGDHQRLFPTPESIAGSDLAFLKMIAARRDTLRCYAEWYRDSEAPQDAEQWLTLKGIGRWTVDYARLRGISDPDIWLSGDLVVKKAMDALGNASPADAAPWRSYLTLQLWSQ
ncbi:DNA-3-methyladenine glycosylase II [Modicisalibacter ilicicola DSM 19980]|uniref:DNA-3-methyladenine glycosylase II n=1 Tax=Modicisalibacter ilicicola DSM 19980 TaxID=1121942 RepID=A0A1M4TKY8_9GAMM|nr:AlkA N-terminal domain-containing protein [Halomonas ilicicola]SHE44957.1 DNA-3-methyladenine glycosylase II [Halomonas ilicicola DSM 19980]